MKSKNLKVWAIIAALVIVTALLLSYKSEVEEMVLTTDDKRRKLLQWANNQEPGTKQYFINIINTLPPSQVDVLYNIVFISINQNKPIKQNAAYQNFLSTLNF